MPQVLTPWKKLIHSKQINKTYSTNRIGVTALIPSGLKFNNIDGHTLHHNHHISRGAAESTPAETAVPVDSLM
jgi:hypothetical protein